MHTVRNRQANKARAEAARSKRSARRHDEGQPPAQAPRFPADLIVPPHRGAQITTAFWPETPVPEVLAIAPKPVVAGRKAIRKAERRAAALARVAAAAPRTTEELIILPEALPEPTEVILAPEPVVPEPAMAEPVPVTTPIPAARALVPHRRGFVDVLAFALRDSGRRLARWSSARRRADDMKEKLARAEARMRAMEAQLAALQALQERVRQAG